MRKFLPFLFAAALASSCIDNAYDLSNVNTDDVTIGDEDSEYRLPLATVYVSMSELNEGGADIKTLFDEADIWLPSPLPGNAAYVDLRELQNTPETITPLLDALIDQMMDDDAKITTINAAYAELDRSGDYRSFIETIASKTDFWGRDLNQVPGFTDAAAAYLKSIEDDGGAAAVRKLLEA